MPSTVKLYRTTVPGRAPTSLVSGQVAINEADGKLYWLDADGTTIRSVTVKGLDTAVAGKLTASNNLSDVSSASTARTNLGLGSAATLASTAVAQTANNLSDLASAGAARVNLGLGSAAVLSSSAVLQSANNLSDVSNPATARGNLGIAIGTNVQAWDADLDAIAAISATSGYLKKTAANTWTLDTPGQITTYTYDNRGSLRSVDGPDKSMALVDGLGLFVFYLGSTEPDDDETCFATASGRWLVEAIHPDLEESINIPQMDFLAEQNILLGLVYQTSLSVYQTSRISFVCVVPGADLGDAVVVNPPSALTSQLTIQALVTAQNTVTIYISNANISSGGTTGSVAAGYWRVAVIKEF